MRTTLKILWGVLFVALVCGAFALATWGIPAPSTVVTKELPTEKFISPQYRS